MNRPGLVQPVGCRRVMSAGVGIALVAAGATMRSAVPATFIHGLNLRVVGVIVMLAGVIALLLSLLAWGAPKTLRRLRLRDAAARPAAACLPGPAASAKAVAAVTGSPHDLRNAQLAEMASEPSRLDAPLSGQPGTALLADLLGEDYPQMDHMLDMQAVAKQWGELSPHEQKILPMRFYDGMTQDEIGQQLGISQMQVSGCSAVRSATVGRACSG